MQIGQDFPKREWKLLIKLHRRTVEPKVSEIGQRLIYRVSDISGSKAFRTNSYIWCYILSLQVSFGDWETILTGSLGSTSGYWYIERGLLQEEKLPVKKKKTRIPRDAVSVCSNGIQMTGNFGRWNASSGNLFCFSYFPQQNMLY